MPPDLDSADPTAPPLRVWTVDLDTPIEGGSTRDPLGELSADERARAGRLRVGVVRDRWVRGRLAARRILAGVRGERADAVPLLEGDGRKPRVADDRGPPFNLSHSGPVFVLACGGHGPVGVDVERVEPLRDLDGVATRVFLDPERDWMNAAEDQHARLRRFYRLWTAKEAVMKYLGTGFALEPSSIALEPTALGMDVASVDHAGWDPDAVIVSHLRLGPGTLPATLDATPAPGTAAVGTIVRHREPGAEPDADPPIRPWR